MYTICYVLTDNEKLRYYNELLISLRSLRLQMSEAKVCVLLDDNTAGILKAAGRRELEVLFHAETKVICIDGDYTQKEKSRYLKLKTREYLSGTILFLDSDTVLAGPLPEEISPDPLAMVLDYNTRLLDRVDYDEIVELNRKYHYELDVNGNYYNSGVMWARDTEKTRLFFDSWFSEWDSTRNLGHLDQPRLNHINRQMGGVISRLDDRYNLQVNAIPFPLNSLHDALVIHYFNSFRHSAYLLNDPGYLNLPYDSEEIKKIIEAPGKAFKKCMIVETDSRKLQFLKSRSFSFLASLYEFYCRMIHP